MEKVENFLGSSQKSDEKTQTNAIVNSENNESL